VLSDSFLRRGSHNPWMPDRVRHDDIKESRMSKTSRINKAKVTQDKQAALSGKVENDFNKMGEQRPTQKNEGRRTPQSRHDRDTQVGSQNQNRARRGQGGLGH
jgi:hypothetical protein